MWRNRYDDLWLWPMPEWFVRLCNRTIGAYVLDCLLASVCCGTVLSVVGNARHLVWLRVVGYALIAPSLLFMVMMTVTALYHGWKHRKRPPAMTSRGKLAMKRIRKPGR